MIELSDTDRIEAFKRAEREPRYKWGDYICIGGIGSHAPCFGHNPKYEDSQGASCPYCICLP